MRRVKVAGTDIETSALGLGCATLFHLPRGRDRRVLLEAAYDSGIGHFDVAPIYGLGLSEREIAPFMKRRRETITLTTKFGIDPSLLGQLAGRSQRPVRTMLGRLPHLSRGIKDSGRGPSSGWIGQLLYTSVGYSPRSAQASLERSMKALGTDYVDVLMLHDPTGGGVSSAPELAAYLDLQVNKGTIRAWGVAADIIEPSGPVRALSKRSQVLQYRSDIFSPPSVVDDGGAQGAITFGIMERALPLLAHYFGQSEEAAHVWGDRLGIDVLDRVSLPGLLVRHALRQNTLGPVLISSTRPERVRSAAMQADDQDAHPATEESKAIRELAEELRIVYPRLRATR